MIKLYELATVNNNYNYYTSLLIMILGLGTDIVNINRIEELMKEFGLKFLTKSFTENEIKASERFNGIHEKRQKAQFFSKRYAAKEAFAKAIGTGFRNGLNLKDIEIANNELGKPYIILTQNATKITKELFNEEVIIHLSLSDDYPLAVASVILSVK